MDEIAKQSTIAKIVDECIESRETDWYALWSIVGDVEQRFPAETQAGIKHLALDAVRLLIGRGFRAGDWSKLGYRFWPEKDADSIVARISREWQASGKDDPHRLKSICSICLFGEFEMDEAAKQAKVAEFSAEYCSNKGNDQSQLGGIASAIRYECGIESNEEVKRLTLEVVRAIVTCGLRVGYFKFYGDTNLILWPEQDAKSVVARIDREWDPKRGDPGLPEPICWFE